MLTVNMLWVGGHLTRIEQVCLRSWAHFGNRVVLWCYGDVGGIPEGIETRDAHEVFDPARLVEPGKTLDDYDSFGGLSDVFRYHMLHQGHGGWWSDTDVLCVNELGVMAEMPYVFGFEDRKTLGTAVVHLPAESEITGRILKRLQENWKIPWNKKTGPEMLTRVVRNMGLIKWAFPPRMFFPIPYQNWREAYGPCGIVPENSKTVHLWNEMGRRLGMDKNREFYPDSLFEQIAAKVL